MIAQQRRAAWLIGGMGGLLVAVSLSAALGGLHRGDPWPALAIGNLSQLIAVSIAVGACVGAARRGGEGRAAWVLFACAAGSWGIGQLVWTYYELFAGVVAPIPSLADVGYLLFIPLTAAALVVFAFGSRWSPVAAGPVLDGVLLGGIGVLVAWPLFLANVLAAAPDAWAAVVSVAYPIGDVILIGLLLSLLVSTTRRGGFLLFFAFLLCFALGDVGLAFGTVKGTYATGQVLDVGWIAGFILLSVAATLTPARPLPRATSSSLARALPFSAVLILIGASLLRFVRGALPDPVERVAMAIVLLFAGLRQAALLREYDVLNASQKSAIDALQKSEAHLDEAQHLARMGSWEHAIGPDKLSFSDESYRIMGSSPEELEPTYAAVLSRVHPEDRERVDRAYHAAVEEHTPLALDHRIVRPDGVTRIVSTRGLTEFDAAGRPVRVTGTMRDVTEDRERDAEEHRLRSQLDEAQALAHVGSASWDVASGQATFSREMYRILHREPGLGPPPTIEETVALIAARDRERFGQALEECLARGGTLEMDVDIETGSDEARSLAIKMETTVDPSGALTMVRASAQDITQRKRTEAVARFHAHLLNTIGEAVLATDLEGTLTYWNDAAARLYGWRADEIIGRSIELVLDGKPDQPGDLVAVGDQWARRKDGTVFVARFTTAPLLEAGQLAGFIGVSIDVTEERATERAIRASEAHLREAQAITRLGSWEWERSSERMWWSEELYVLFDRPPAAGPPTAEEFYALFPPEGARELRRAHHAALATGTPYSIDLTLQARSDGERRWITCGGSAFEDGTQEVLGLRGTMQDITERKLANDLLHRNESLGMLGTLVAGVAHEINNPLTYIRGSVEFIRSSAIELVPRALPEDAKAIATMKDDADTALRGLDRIAAITNGLRQVARPTSGGRARERLNELIVAILPVARPRFRPGIDVKMDLRSESTVLVNPHEISQVLLNLLFNASDAMHERGEVITITTRDSPDEVIVEVADEGTGIPSDAAENIFHPFFTTKAQGTGLGLSISRSIAEAYGGTLTFETQAGKGTVFRLGLPRSTK